ncbi:class I SAM-dependent methyltransferase [Aquisphaera insulae]|uniref:class I SAM-dependent methyltransferase n=1 Tax=Aquisphaera insulae TaxID=2712864 RepID=UPI00202F1AE2|nr:methyltransferase domain-containing protein [Aquisphaera insulae]
MDVDQIESTGRRAAPATEYHGPVIVSRLEFAGHEVALVRPGEPDRMLDDQVVRELNRREDYMPYWAYLWPGACLLAQAIATEPSESLDRLCGRGDDRREAIEIGCGVGLAGLVGLRRGLRILFTDYDPAPLDFVRRSVEESGLAADRFRTALLDWRSPPEGRYPLILGSDVLYESRLVPLVAGLLARLLEPGGEAWISDPGRNSAGGFRSEVESRGLDAGAEAISSRGDGGGVVTGILYRVRRPITPRDGDDSRRDPDISAPGH